MSATRALTFRRVRGAWRAALAREAQSTVLVGLLLVPLCLFAGLAVDGGYGMVQLREAQNAADFASSGAVYALQGVCSGQGTETNASVSSVVSSLVTANAPDAVGAWQAVYLDASGNVITDTPTLPTTTGYAPTGACGLQVDARPKWPTFFLSLIGMSTLSAQANAGAIWGNSPSGAPAGGPTSTTGTPIVGSPGYTPSGTPTSPGTPSTTSGTPTSIGVGHGVGIVALAASGKHTIYGGGSGQFIINGDIMDDSTGITSNPGGYADTVDNFQTSSTVITGHLYSVAPVALDPCFAPAGVTSATCPGHGTTVSYAQGMVGSLPYMPDPLAYIGAPAPAATACPPSQSPVLDPPPVDGVYSPGVYDYPVAITSSATFADCGGLPGVYIFEQGVAICPGADESVVGQDVMLYSEAAGPGHGTGCGLSGPATTAGIYLGGQGTITLSGPTSGLYSHLVLYQARADAANVGLDDAPGDSATVNITGTVYDNTDPAGGSTAAGVLVSGVKAKGGSPAGGGTISLDGMAVVDAFSTSGTANVTITYDPSQVPASGPVLVR